MAQRIGALSGPLAFGLSLGPIIAGFLAVIFRAETQSPLSAADWASIRFTITQALLSALGSVALAIPLARALARRDFPGRSGFVLLLGAPFILPVIVAVLGLIAVYGRGGWVSAALGWLGLEPISIYGLHGVVLAHIFFNAPLATRLLYHGWNAVPGQDFRLAAQLDLKGWAFFRVIELPILRQILPGAFALIFVLCLTSFTVALTLGGGPAATTVELAIYQAVLFDFDLSRAAKLSVVQIGLALLAVLFAARLLQSPLATARLGVAPRRVKANSLISKLLDTTWIALGGLFLLLPLLATIISGLPALIPALPLLLAPIGTSLAVAALSAALGLALSLGIAAWIATHSIKAAEAFPLAGLVVSPMVLAVGWFILINPFIAPQKLALPVTAIANALIALPFAVRILLPQMRRLLNDYERLCAAFGLRGLSLWRIVMLPSLRKEIGYALGLICALSLGDVGVLLLFADTGTATLPVQMYRLMASYQMDAAAAAALILLVLCLAAFWISERVIGGSENWGRADD